MADGWAVEAHGVAAAEEAERKRKPGTRAVLNESSVVSLVKECGRAERRGAPQR